MKRWWIYFFIAICFFSVVLFVVFNFVIFKPSYDKLIKKYANEYQIEESLVFAVVKNESTFNKNAMSSSGARGLMQLVPSTAKWIAGELGEIYYDDMLFEPETNIKYGCFYLRYLFDKFEFEDVVVCAYNAGETKVRDWLNSEGKLDKSKINYNETKIYLERVLADKEFFK